MNPGRDDRLLSEGEPVSRRMGKICQPIMNSVNEDLTFTTEVAEDFADNFLHLALTLSVMG